MSQHNRCPETIDGAIIIRFRNKINISQKEFAQQCELSQAAIQQIETSGVSDPRISTVKKIADRMECTIDDLLLK